MYHIDYLFTDKEFNTVSILTEDRGCNPKFIIAPDDSVWVSLSSTATVKDGEICLPLFDRSRITKDIVYKDIGTDVSFVCNGRAYAYITEIISTKKCDKVFWYQFDKEDLFRTRKQFKLENIKYGHPKVISDKLYIAYIDRCSSVCKVSIAEADETCNVVSLWNGEETEDIFDACLYSYTQSEIKIITYNAHRIEMIVFSANGTITARNILYKTDMRINYIKVKNNSVEFVIASEDGQSQAKNCILIIEDNTVCYEYSNGFSPEYLCDDRFLLAPIKMDKNEFMIVNIL